MCVFQNYTRLMASFPGQAGTRKEKASLDLNKARDDGILGWQWHQLDHMQTLCTSLQTDNHASTLSLICVYLQAGCSSDTQPTVSKYWRHCLPEPKALLALQQPRG